MFEALAKLVIKRHKLIIAFWVIVFICALPSLRLIKDVIVYEESEVSPLSTSNQISQKIIDEEFPKLLPESNAIIVVQADDVRSADMKDFMLELENRIWAANDSGKLKGVSDVLTIYSTSRTRVMEPVILSLAPMLGSADGTVNSTARMLFEMPAQFHFNYTTLDRDALRGEFAEARRDIFEVPSIFLQEWDRTAGDWRNRTDEARNATLDRTAYDKYTMEFAANWTESWESGSPFSSAEERAQYAVYGSAQASWGFAAQTLGTDRDVARYIAASSLSLSNFTNVQSIERSEQYYFNYMAKLRTWDSLIRFADPPLNATEQIQQVTYLEDYFFTAWNGSFHDPSTSGLSDLDRTEYAMDVAVPKVLDQLDRTETEKEIILDSLDEFSIGNWKDGPIRHSFMLDSVAKLAKDRYDVTVPKWFLQEVHSLGSNATAEQATELANSIVRERTLDEYPIPIPKQIMTSFIDSKNGTILAVVGFSGDSSEKSTQKDLIELKRIVDSTASSREEWKGYDILITGDTAIDYDMRHSAEKDSRLIEPFTAILVILFIAFYFRSAVAPWVPLLAVGMAFVMTQGLMYIIGSYMNGIHYSIQLVVFTMIMGAGADYCIIIVSRFREERIKGRSKDESIETAVVWAGESITTSGATAMVAFLALAIFSFPLLRVMGMCLSVAIGMTLLIALTLIPSLLYLIGDWVFWPTMGKRWDKYRARMKDKMRFKKGYFFKAAKVSLRYSWAIVAACMLISIPTTYLVLKLEPNYDFVGSMPDVEAKQGVEAMTEGFGAGNILPTYVVVQFYEGIYDESSDEFNETDLEVCDRLAENLSSQETVFKVTSSAYNTQSGLRIDRTPSWTEPEMNLSLGKSRNTVMLTVVLVDEPTSSEAVRAVKDLRTLCEEFKEKNSALTGAEVHIGGSSVGTANIGDTISADFPLAVIIVMAGVYVILLFVLGSVLIPLRLMLTILLSISWTLALALVIFIWSFGIPVLWILPVLLFVILMGLGMDYDIFLMTRIKEEMVKGRTDEKAIAHAVEYTGGIITICGIIMAGAFGTMMISSNGLLREFGFGLSFAILLDAMIVRIFLVPAIMVMLKKWNWWAPFGLQKINKKT